MAGIVQNRVAELVARRRRQEADFPSTYRELAAATGLSLPAIQRWMNNDVEAFYSDAIAAWIELLGVDIGELLIYEPGAKS